MYSVPEAWRVAPFCYRSAHLLLFTYRLAQSFLQGHAAAYEGANDVRRYLMLYYWLLCFQVPGGE